jgi:hypothetical protein
MQRFSFALPRTPTQQFKPPSACCAGRRRQLDPTPRNRLLGRPRAGQFVVTLADQRETIPFRLAGTALAGYDAIGQATALPPDRRLVGAEMKGSTSARASWSSVRPRAETRSGSTPGSDPGRRRRPAGRLRKSPAIALRHDLTEAAALRPCGRSRTRGGPGASPGRRRLLRLLGNMARQPVTAGTRGRDTGRFSSCRAWAPNSAPEKPVRTCVLRRRDLARPGHAVGPPARLDPRPTQTPGGTRRSPLQLLPPAQTQPRPAGFDADFHHYDWRRPVRDLGAEFAAFLNRRRSPSRSSPTAWALSAPPPSRPAPANKVKRVIMVGTPNRLVRAAQAFRAASVPQDPRRHLRPRPRDHHRRGLLTFAGLYGLLAAPGPNFPATPASGAVPTATIGTC